MDSINILFSSDDYYAQHLGVAIATLLEQNRSFRSICIYLIDAEITKENKDRIQAIIDKYSNAHIYWIPFKDFEDRLQLNLAWPISKSSYARLFVGDVLPQAINRVLYMDCDMLVCKCLESLWNTDLDGCMIGAVQDAVPTVTKQAVGVPESVPYFNAGLLLIDLKKWREQQITRRCLDFLNEHEGKVVHHDQGVLNGVLQNRWYRLPIENNLMTIHYFFNGRQMKKYYNDCAEFYSESEVDQAKTEPTILHFTPSFTSRPWEKGSAHPRKGSYWEAIRNTPWFASKPIANSDKWYVRLINWRYRKLPY